jgi:hypothetical protein
MEPAGAETVGNLSGSAISISAKPFAQAPPGPFRVQISTKL